jgi:hypothetical protein
VLLFGGFPRSHRHRSRTSSSRCRWCCQLNFDQIEIDLVSLFPRVSRYVSRHRSVPLLGFSVIRSGLYEPRYDNLEITTPYEFHVG